MAARRSAGLFSSEIWFAFWMLLLPRLAGVTNALCLLLGAPKVGALGPLPARSASRKAPTVRAVNANKLTEFAIIMLIEY